MWVNRCTLAEPPLGGAAHVGFLRRLFSRPPTVSRVPPKFYGGDETLEVVGESFHQETLWALAGGRSGDRVDCPIRAVLVPEPDNPVDPNAVMVLIEGNCVGHLSRDDAAAYLPGLQSLMAKGPVGLEGVIVGGGRRNDGIGFLGVFLDHDPQDFGLLRAGYGGELRTGFSEAAATDLEDDSYDLSWYHELSDDHGTAIQQLRRMLETERDPIDRHYMLSERAKRLYKCRDTVPTALDDFDTACREHRAEMVTIRHALFKKFGQVPVIETYRQAVIRCQKAKDWAMMREWAEHGISVYGEHAARPEAVEDLHKRLAYALAKIDAATNPKPQRKTQARAATAAVAVVETLICTECGATFERMRTRGRKPHTCPTCRGVSA
jgi:rubrerythrin